MTNQNITRPYLLVGFIAVAFTWLSHEFAHWITSQALGYSSAMTLNSTTFLGAKEPTQMHQMFISAAGPMITLLQAIIIYIWLKASGWNKYLYPFLFTAFYMRALAGVMNVIHPNDEGRISVLLDLGLYTLPVIMSVSLLLMVIAISRKFDVNWKFQWITTLMVMVFSSAIILTDQFFNVRIL